MLAAPGGVALWFRLHVDRYRDLLEHLADPVPPADPLDPSSRLEDDAVAQDGTAQLLAVIGPDEPFAAPAGPGGTAPGR